MSRPRKKSPGRGTHRVKFPDTVKQHEALKEFRDHQEMSRERKIAQETVKPLLREIIKGLFAKPKKEWPIAGDTESLKNMFNNAVMAMNIPAEVAKSIAVAALPDDYIFKMANKYKREAQEELREQEKEEWYRREEEKKESQRRKLCENLGICSVAGLAAAGAGAVVGAPVIATTAAAAAAAAAVGRYRGAFGGRKKTRKRQRKSKRKSRRKKRKKRKKRKTRRLRRKSR